MKKKKLSSNDSMAERFLTNVNGGAVAVWSPTGLGLPSGHAILDKGLFEVVFNDYNSILGSAINQAKLSLFLQSGERYKDLLQTYTLFGDPALRLKVKKKGNSGRVRATQEQEPTGFDGILQSTITNHESSRRWRDEGKRGAGE